MQAGACTTAFNAGFEGLEHPKWDAKHPFEHPKQDAKHIDLGGVYMGLNSDILPAAIEPLEHPKKDAKHPLERPKKDAKRKKGTGDTDTTGKHNTRYKAYCKAVNEGVLNPSINAFSLYEYQGKKIGKITAKIFLQAMCESGLVQKTEKGGKTAWVKCA